MNPTVVPLSAAEISQQLSQLQGWNLNAQGKLAKEFEFKNFIEAFAFMSRVAHVAEEKMHHPEWFNVYNRVRIELITHDAGNAISQKDFDLAHLIEQCVHG